MSNAEDDIRLFPGITGFHHASEPEPPLTEVTEFQRVVAERTTPASGFRLRGFDVGIQGAARSYYQALLEELGSGMAVQLLLNPFGQVLAAALDDQLRPGVLLYDIKFVEVGDRLQRAFSDTWSVASMRALSRKLTPADLGCLNRVERSQVSYWEPETVGELVFNHWD